MTAKTARIEDILNTREWQGPNGTVYYFDILLDNGDRGSIGKKSADALQLNQTLTYTLEEGERGNKIKEYREPFNGNGNGQPRSNGSYAAARQMVSDADRNRSFALSYAKDLTVALIAKAPETYKSDDVLKVTTHIADGLLNWLNQESK